MVFQIRHEMNGLPTQGEQYSSIKLLHVNETRIKTGCKPQRQTLTFLTQGMSFGSEVVQRLVYDTCHIHIKGQKIKAGWGHNVMLCS